MSDMDLATALAKAQAEMTAAQFDAVNPHFKSRYATLASVIEAVRGPLTKHGVAYIQRTVPVDGGVAVETVFMGCGSEISTGMVVVPLDRKTAQSFGSALTYARRYSLAMACCISADEDDDGNEAEKGASSRGRGKISAVEGALDGSKVDRERAKDYASSIKACIANEDWPGYEQLHQEMADDADMKLAVWAELNSVERRQIKEYQAQKAAA
jgi:hypothetical protein